MAQSILASLSHELTHNSPVRVPTHPVLSDVLDQAERVLGQCDWSDEWCDCYEDAVVHHLQSEREFCLRHFQKTERAL